MPPTYIGYQGLYFEGHFQPWNCYYQSLTEARLAAECDSVLELTFRNYSGKHSSYRTVRVPVPAGYLQEAKDVVKALSDQPESDKSAQQDSPFSENVLAKWTYDSYEWNQFVHREVRRALTDHLAMGVVLLIVGLVLGAIPGVPLWLYTGRVGLFLLCEAVLPVFFLLGWLVIFFVVSVPEAWKIWRELGGVAGEALLTEEGLTFNGEFRPWKATGRSEAEAEFLSGTNPIFEFSYQAMNGQYTMIRVPVPTGHEGEAERIAVHVNRALS